MALTSTLIGVPARSAQLTAKSNKPDLSSEFFHEETIRTFDFKVPEAALAQLEQSPRTYVSGEITEGSQVLTDVGIRLKGMGSFRSIDEKPSFAVKFDEFVEKQTYRGLKKLMFNNSVQDPTYVGELLATELFRQAGVPTARVTHARVRLNGRDLGLYVVIEAMNKDFLKRHFGSGKGNLYESYLQDIDGRMEQDSGDDETREDLRILNEACVIPDADERWQRLNEVLDVDRFVSFVAMEMLITHWDGYAMLRNNYRIYHDPKTDRMVFITHGLDAVFRRPHISIEPPLMSAVVRAVLTTPHGEELYFERFEVLFAEVFNVPMIHARMDEALAKFRRFKPRDLPQIERRASQLRERIALRASRVEQQLHGIEPERMKFDAAGYSYPESWRDESDRGEAVLDRIKFDGRPTLRIRAGGTEQTRASWRSQIFLAPGLYRFEGRVRARLMNSGYARLRISGDRRSPGISGNNTWQMLSHDFEIEDGNTGAELVCELNALRGDVWFNLASLRVKQITAPGERAIIRRPALQE